MQLRTGRSRFRRDKSSPKASKVSNSRSEDEGEFQPFVSPSVLPSHDEKVVLPTAFSPRLQPAESSHMILNQEDDVSFDESSSTRSRKSSRILAGTSDSGFSSRLSIPLGRTSIEDSSPSGSAVKDAQPHTRKKHWKPRHESNCRRSATLAYDNYSSSSDSSSPSFSHSSNSSSCGKSNPSSSIRRTKHRIQESPQCRRQRWLRTADVLKKSGLLDITIKTAELLRKNQKIQKEIELLQKETEKFVASVLRNPENQQILEGVQSSAQLYEVVVPGSKNLMVGGSQDLSPNPFTFSKVKSSHDRPVSSHLFSHLGEDNENSCENVLTAI